MHIPDGFLGPKTCLVCYAAVVPFWVVAWRRLQTRLQGSYEIPYVAVASAFVFVLMLFNLPIPGGTSGHAVGAALLAIVLGFGPAVLAVSFALAVQALLFQDGGITAFGANALNMAVVQAATATLIWKVAAPAGRELRPTRRTFLVAFAAGYGASVASAAATALQLGLQPVLEHNAAGQPLYFPISLPVTMTAMMASHGLIGILEGGVTAFAVAALARAPGLLPPAEPTKEPSGFWSARRREAVLGVGTAMILLTPLGLWLPKALGAADPWGEWGPAETAAQAGLTRTPAGLQRLSDLWRAPAPDYQISGASASPAGESLEYVGAAVLGVVVITLLFAAIGFWQRRQTRHQE